MTTLRTRLLGLALTLACALVPWGVLAQSPVVPYVKSSSGATFSPVTPNNGLPMVPLMGSNTLATSTSATTGAAVAVLGSTSSVLTTYLCGFDVSAAATSGTIGSLIVSDTAGGNLGFNQATAVSPLTAQLRQTFAPCLPARAAGISITITSNSVGAGGRTTVNAWGFKD